MFSVGYGHSDHGTHVQEAEIISDVDVSSGNSVKEAEILTADDLPPPTEIEPMNEYIGEYDAQGRKHGKGKRTWDGAGGFRNVYEGDWVEDVIQGEGAYTVNGEVLYEGEFERNMFHGKGKLRIKNATYEGQMFDNRMHGQGKLTYDSGAVYTGEFVNGKKMGECVYVYPDGDVYEGGIDNDTMVGRGVMRFASGMTCHHGFSMVCDVLAY